MNISYKNNKISITELGNSYAIKELSTDNIILIEDPLIRQYFGKVKDSISKLVIDDRFVIEALEIYCTDQLISIESLGRNSIQGSVMASELGYITNLRTVDSAATLSAFLLELSRLAKVAMEVNTSVSGVSSKFTII